MIPGPSEETSNVAITLNQESNSTCRGKNHFPFHWNILTGPESLILRWMYRRKVVSMIIGASILYRWSLEHRWIKRRVPSMDRFHTIHFIEGKASRRIHVVGREINITASNNQTWSFVEKYVREFKNEEETKLGQWKSKVRERPKATRYLFHRPRG